MFLIQFFSWLKSWWTGEKPKEENKDDKKVSGCPAGGDKEIKEDVKGSGCPMSK